MPNIINETSFASGLGQAVGGGLGAGLSQLTNQKLAQMQQGKERESVRKGLQMLPGINAQTAEGLSLIPKEHLGNILKEIIRQPQNAELARQWAKLAENNEGLENQEQAPMQNEQPPTPPGQQPAPQQMQGQPSQIQNPAQNIPGQKVGGRPPQVQNPVQAGLTGKGFEDLAKAKIAINEAEKKRDFAREQANNKELTSDKRARWKTAQPFIDEVSKEDEGATESLAGIEHMRELMNSGELSNNVYYDVLKSLGLDYNFLLNPADEDYLKTQAGMVKGIRSVFTRPTNYETQQWLKTIPTLSNTPEGKKRIMDTMEIYNKAKKVRTGVMDDILEKSPNGPPDNFRRIVSKETEKRLKSLDDEFTRRIREDLGIKQHTTSKSLPKPGSLPMSATIRDPNSKLFFRQKDNKWQEVTGINGQFVPNGKVL